MIVGIGTDVCDIRRIAQTMERRGDRFAERFEKYGVTAYFAGHDHHMEHVAPKGYHFQQFVDGAHSVRSATPGPDSRFCKAVPGFATVQVREDSLVVRFLDGKRYQLYRAAVAPRKP